ncbi:adenylate/guanylate cyclase domain-containing protein [Maribacter confluentis]|uniref:Adenylate/guanylate cyclase domain-containing protein n=1 Tax=Maribacter confluentis TaxID=1656093 RepID=A0ABT8RKE3_9FLAO|nr:adenylate/guanylate cyclase domain-containing protein [Maribacter confluentis]MDO1511451.1 adenylate/guanylate cyclase domain-containing protein [Maribacter confluentis]
MKKVRFIFFLICLQSSVYSQTELDSLYQIWNNEKLNDSIRAQAYNDYIYDGFYASQPDSALILLKELYQFTKKTKNDQGLIEALTLKGYLQFRMGDYTNALVSYDEGLELAEKINDKLGTADILIKIGYIYHDNEDVVNALVYYQKSLKIYEAENDLNGKGSIYNEFGSIYLSKDEFDKALEYYKKSIAINNELNDEDSNSSMYINIGNLYLAKEEFEPALEYYEKGLKIEKKKNDKLGIAAGLSGIGTVYLEQGETEKALDFLQKSFDISESINDIQGGANSLLTISDIYLDKKNYLMAISLCKKSLEMTQKVGDLGGQEFACECLYEAYRALNNNKEALIYHEKMILISDSIKTEDLAIKLQQIEFAKKVMADSLVQIEKDMAVQLQHKAEVQRKDKNRNLAIGVGSICFLLALGFFSRWHYVKKSKDILKKEKDRSESLLLNILPAEIAEELKEKGEAQARDFDLVSILFTDFKGFTEMSAELSAAELIGEINHCFKAFDLICEKYKIEKIKTIGDAYMAAGGLPIPSTDSVQNTVLAALEMQSFMTKRFSDLETTDGFTFEMRLGIHTGPVVAGIVGVKKFQYDIWGDTVNTAARIESSGAVGQVNISQSTYELLKDNNQFNFTHRGKIQAKGKGKIDMYFVTPKDSGD